VVATKVHIVLFLYGGIPDVVDVFQTKKAANARYQEIRRDNKLNPRDPHNDDCDLYLYEDVEVA
jgi:hypothetical protein